MRLLILAALLCWASPVRASEDAAVLTVLLCPASTDKTTCTADTARDFMSFSITPAQGCPQIVARLQIDSANWGPLPAPGDWFLFTCARRL